MRSSEDVLDMIFLAKKFFSRVSIDLIFGMPMQTLKDLEEDLVNSPIYSKLSEFYETADKDEILKLIDAELENYDKGK